jgi:hypothetical protein
MHTEIQENIEFSFGELDQNADELAYFLRDRLGLYYCGDCIYEEVTAISRNQINRLKHILLTVPQNFDEGTECDGCQRKLKTVAYLPRPY